MLINLTHNVADKIGSVSGYGWAVEGPANVHTWQSTDGRSCAVNETGSFWGPLKGCILSEADRYIPTGMMPNIRIQLTLDSIANIFAPPLAAAVALNLETGTPASSVTVTPTDFILSDFVLSYSQIDFGTEVDNAVRSMGEKITIKSQSFNSSSNPINTGTGGQFELIYYRRWHQLNHFFFIVVQAPRMVNMMHSKLRGEEMFSLVKHLVFTRRVVLSRPQYNLVVRFSWN